MGWLSVFTDAEVAAEMDERVPSRLVLSWPAAT